MGLDNGIMLKIIDKEKFGPMPAWIKREEWEDKYGYDYEILYWRKCWNVRDVILFYLNGHGEGGDHPMNLDDLEYINKTLKKLYTKKNWDERQSIWSWDEIKDTYKSNLKYAEKVAKWLQDKPEGSYELYFYDSYQKQEEIIMALNHLKLRRRELVWDIYECNYYDTDWATMKEFIQRQAEINKTDEAIARWNGIKDVSFEDLMAMCNGEMEPVRWEFKPAWSKEYTYHEDIVDLVKEWMRDDAWECGAIDSYSADDSDEEFDVVFYSDNQFLS